MRSTVPRLRPRLPTPLARNRGRRAHVDPPDDRAPTDRSLGCAGLPALRDRGRVGSSSPTRERMVELLREGETKPTVNDVLTRLVASALQRHPAVNALFVDGKIHRYQQRERRHRRRDRERPRRAGHPRRRPEVGARDRRRSRRPRRLARGRASSRCLTSKTAPSRSRIWACTASSSSSPCSIHRRWRSSRSARSRIALPRSTARSRSGRR